METFRRSMIAMNTLVTLQVVVDDTSDAIEAWCARAFGWFAEVERVCTRFDPDSEVMALSRQVGVPLPVSATLFAAVQFALAVAEASGGTFDPTLGLAQERRGFNRHYRTGHTVVSDLAPDRPPTYRDVLLDPAQGTVTLQVPLVLDLGAVAKGLAIDLAAREFHDCAGCLVEAGGDLSAHGHNGDGELWHVGIRHPLHAGELIAALRLTDAAVCTSGGYERPAPDTDADTADAAHAENHLLDPRTGHSPAAAASVTVVAPTAMAADALSTAAFILGPTRGLRLLTRQGVEGLIFTPSLTRHATSGMRRFLQ